MSCESDFSSFSLQTQAVFDTISQKIATNKLYKLEDAAIDENTQVSVWDAFGQYVLSQLKHGRAVVVPKFGIFTFTWPDVDLTGTTNEIERHKDHRRPLFLLNKDFARGTGVRQGIYSEGTVTSTTHAAQTGKIPQVKVSLLEVGSIAGTSKEVAKICLERMFREILTKIKNGQNTSIDIPYVGNLIIRNKSVAVRFYEAIEEDVKGAAKRNILSKSMLGLPSSHKIENLPSIMQQTSKNDSLLIDEGAQSWLKRNLDIDVSSLSQDKIRTKLFASTTMNRKFLSPSRARETINSFSSTSSSTDLIKNKLKAWILNRNLSVRDAFYELVSENVGLQKTNSSSRLNPEDFQIVIKEQDIKLTRTQCQTLFNWLDANEDGYINVSDWMQRLEDKTTQQNYLTSSLRYLNIDSSDGVLKRLHIDPRQNIRLGREDFRLYLHKIDPTLSAEQIESTIQVAFDDREVMETADLKDFIEQTLQSGKKEPALYEIKRKVSQALQRPENLAKLKQDFEGKTIQIHDMRNFATSVLTLSKVEALKLASHLDTTQKGITLNKLLTEFGMTKPQAPLDSSQLAQAISSHIESLGLSYQALLKQVAENERASNQETSPTSPKKSSFIFNQVKSHTFANFLGTILHRPNINELMQYASSIDIDRDGFISKDDLETFMRQTLAQSNGGHINIVTEPLTTHYSIVETLSDADVNRYISDLRRVLSRKRITNQEFFRKLDTNEDGFLTMDEFCKNLEYIFPLPQKVKEGLFVAMDKLKIRMIDFNTLLKTMERNILIDEVVVSGDSFDWCLQILRKMREYFEQRGVNQEDAFRMVDIDFDGNISKQDLKEFLIKVLKVTDEVTDVRLDRLFKLQDQYKRGYIQRDDFKRIFDDSVMQQTSSTYSSTPTYSPSPLKQSPKRLTLARSTSVVNQRTTSSIFDWKLNAKQQIGLVLSKRFPNIGAAFEEISCHNNRILYQNLLKWIESARALQGFNLTESLLLQFFAELDPDKKGYLVYADFEEAFGNYNWNSQLLSEIQDVICSNFNDPNAAFQYFIKHGENSSHQLLVKYQNITYQSFFDSINSLLPKRFTSANTKSLWRKLVKDAETLNYSDFCDFISAARFKKNPNSSSTSSLRSLLKPASTITSSLPRHSSVKSLREGSLRRSLNISSELSKSMVKIGKPDASDATFERLKQILRSSGRGIIELFKEVDTTNSGKVSPIEFKSIIGRLNLGLSSYETNLLLDFCDVKEEGYLDWMSFVSKLSLRETDCRLFQRCKLKLKQIKDNIYAFMLTPRDAFMQFNKDGSGKLTYQEFSEFIIQLSELAKEEIPPFSTIKDLFDFIDMKKDGIIDINEWTQTFNQLPIIGNSTNTNTVVSLLNFSKEILTNKTTDWENTKNYDEIMACIGRNRKLIYNMFCSLEQQRIPITYEAAKKVLSDVVSNAQLHMSEKNWTILLKFAEKDGLINYKLLVNVYRDRLIWSLVIDLL